MATLEQRYDSLLEALAALKEELKRVKDENLTLWAEKVQWQRDKVNQQNIIAQALGQANETNNAYLEENQRLRERIRELGG